MSDFERAVYCLCGLPFDAVTLKEVVSRLRDAIEERKPFYLSTPNVNFLVASQVDEQFQHSLIDSDLLVADGMPLVWIARLLGIPIHQRVAGSSLFEVLHADRTSHLKVYFFGGQTGVAEAACRKLNGAQGGLVCSGFQAPGFGPVEAMSDQSRIDLINDSKADFLIVSLGARKGQQWIVKNRGRIAIPAISNFGAVVNFVAGTVRRAPTFLQRSGLEWLWRIKEEPHIWKRYLSDGLALARLLCSRIVPYAWYLHNNQPMPTDLAHATVRGEMVDGETVLRIRGAWVDSNLSALRSTLKVTVQDSRDIEIDMTDVAYVDSAFVGLMILLHGHQRKIGKRLSLRSVPDPIRKVLTWNCVEYLIAAE